MGLGLGIGILLHILLDLLIWFNGALYLLSLGLAFGVTLRMRETVEAVAR